jgi:hypothetical protein
MEWIHNLWPLIGSHLKKLKLNDLPSMLLESTPNLGSFAVANQMLGLLHTTNYG